MKIIHIKTKKVRVKPKANFTDWIVSSCQASENKLRNGDIIIISSKILSYFENMVLDLSKIKISEKSKDIAKKMNTKPELIEIVLQEADEVIAETKWVLLTKKNGIYCANAGVDLSNVPKGYAVLWPKDPFMSARTIAKELKKKLNLRKLGIIIADSACSPGRAGTTSVAIGYYGVKGYEDLKGKEDLFKNKLRYSALNLVDSLATAANLIMGESKERTPLAIIREYKWTEYKNTKKDEMNIPSSEDLYQI